MASRCCRGSFTTSQASDRRGRLPTSPTRSSSRSATRSVTAGPSADCRVASTRRWPPRWCSAPSATRLTCVFVDHGLLRAGERGQVQRDFVAATGAKLVTVDVAERFLEALSGVTNPEGKRKIIGREFIRAFEGAVRNIVDSGGGEVDFLVQGTLYPDVVRVRRRHGSGQHQEPPQRRGSARRSQVQARRAAAAAVQGRGPRRRPGTRPARGDRCAPNPSRVQGSASGSSAKSPRTGWIR